MTQHNSCDKKKQGISNFFDDFSPQNLNFFIIRVWKLEFSLLIFSSLGPLDQSLWSNPAVQWVLQTKNSENPHLDRFWHLLRLVFQNLMRQAHWPESWVSSLNFSSWNFKFDKSAQQVRKIRIDFWVFAKYTQLS